MSCRSQESHTRRRTSERMRLKMLRNVDQYKIANPFRKHHDTMPEELHKQLRKIDYLSSASINTLSIPTSPNHHFRQEQHLMRMAQAHQEQENKFLSIFGQSTMDLIEIDHEHYSHSQAPPTHPSHGPEQHEIKDQLQMHMYDDRSHIHDNLFESRGLAVQQSHLMVQEAAEELPVQHQQPPQTILQDFQQYLS